MLLRNLALSFCATAIVGWFAATSFQNKGDTSTAELAAIYRSMADGRVVAPTDHGRFEPFAINIVPVAAIEVTDGATLELAVDVGNFTPHAAAYTYALSIANEYNEQVDTFVQQSVRRVGSEAADSSRVVLPTDLPAGYYRGTLHMLARYDGRRTSYRTDYYFKVDGGEVLPSSAEEWNNDSESTHAVIVQDESTIAVAE